jgi:sulfatase maturation enzyme AslB (radical SAM superfamily)
MNWDTLRASIDFALGLASSNIELIFLGGEPLLEWNQLRRAVEYSERHLARHKRVNYTLTTNGLLITRKIAAFLNKHRIQTRISFDGVPQAQDYRNKGSFVIIDRLLDRLRLEHPNLFRRSLGICITLIPTTIPYLADSVAYLIGKGVQDISISPCFTPYPGWTDERICQLEAQVSRIYDLSLTHFKKCHKVPVAFLRRRKQKPPRRPKTRDMCGVIRAGDLLIDVDGQAYGCVLFTDSYQKFSSEFLSKRMEALRLGDFRAPDFWKRLAAFPAAARITGIFDHKERKYSSYGRCGECAYLGECAVCPVSIGYDPENRDPHRVPDFICAFNLVTLKYRRRFPVVPDPKERLKILLGLKK